MKVAVIGGTGRAGSEIVKELSSRGHDVTAIARNVDKVPDLPGVSAVACDAKEPGRLATLLGGHDAVVSALRFSDVDPETLIGAIKRSEVKRYLVVGGAASLEGEPGKRLFDQPGFPEAYKPEAGAGIAFLDDLKKSDGLDWTFLSPAMLFDVGPRTGKFRLGKDNLIVAEDGSSKISFADYAIAVVDELEKPQHVKQRFSIGY